MEMRVLLVVVSLLLTCACGQQSVIAEESPNATPSGSAPTATITGGTEHEHTSVEQPPPFRVRYDERELVLHPHTYCYDSGCVDGVDPSPTDIGSPGEIQVYVPVREFELSVYAKELTRVPGHEENPFCGGRTFEVPVEDLGDGWYAVHPHGPAGRYEIELFASGAGDMIGTLRWRTPTDGRLPKPSARLALIADHDGEPDSYGLELAIDDLAATPASVSAEIEVTAGNGKSMTIVAQQFDDPCRSAGDLYFSRPDEAAKAASQLGDFPFTTTVTLTLDGHVHRAVAVYPDDEIEGHEPSVALNFTPELPAQRT
jgi:hypothetical protein